jgi:inhibitor of cysteine peptidase
MLTISKFNLANNQFQYENFMGNSNIVYMTKDRLFIASTLYDISDTKTIIYQFDIRGSLTFLNEVKIDGYLINSFAMDYFDNHLRVATTKTKGDTTVNAIIVFNSNLKQVGIVDNLAKGEVIYSVLFKQDTAYAVTFEQIDPFFVIDLSSPNRPTVLGELKIPGFSSYLHQIDDSFILGFGKDTTFENNVVTTTSFKLSLFDVTNKQDPQEVDQLLLGGFGTHSDVLYDHKALMVDSSRQLYGFTLTDWTFDTVIDGVRDIAVVNDFTYRYQLVTIENSTIVDLFSQDSKKDEYYIRSLIIDDSLYIISNISLEIISLDDFTTIKNISR